MHTQNYMYNFYFHLLKLCIHFILRKSTNFAIKLYGLTSENVQVKNHKAHFEQNLRKNSSNPFKTDVLAKNENTK